jgi:hypothetical protein
MKPSKTLKNPSKTPSKTIEKLPKNPQKTIYNSKKTLKTSKIIFF